jgi:hypothetical protein
MGIVRFALKFPYTFYVLAGDALSLARAIGPGDRDLPAALEPAFAANGVFHRTRREERQCAASFLP